VFNSKVDHAEWKLVAINRFTELDLMIISKNYLF
jgi:hypothetical protein